MSAPLSNPQSGIRNLKFSPDHDRFVSLLRGIVVVGLVLGGVVFVQAAAGIVEGGTLLGKTMVLAPAVLALVVALGMMLSALRPWFGPESALGSAIVVVLVLDAAIGSTSAGGFEVPVLPLLGLQITNLALGVLLAAVVTAYLSYRLSQTYGLLGALLLVATPAMLGPYRTGVWLAFFGTTALLCLFLWCETKKLHWLTMAGLGCGLAACGHRWGGAFSVVALGLSLMIFLSRRSQTWNATTGYALVFLLLSTVVSGAWEVIAASAASADAFVRPMVVYDPAVFASQGLPGDDATVAATLAGIVNSVSGLPLGDVRLPSALVLGPALVCFLPWSFKGKWAYEKRALLVIVFLAVSAAAASGTLKSIGLLPIAPLLAILTVYGIHNLYMNVRRPALLVASVVALFLWNGPTFWNTIA